ncbi:MAG: CalY family protein, partial [Patescibacteria group bacterium]|nr:CalY family protein [Patescibacteria group bacterium]
EMKSPKIKQKPARQKRIKSLPRKKTAASPVKIRQFLVGRNRSKALVLDILKSKPALVALPKKPVNQHFGFRNFFFKTAPVILMALLLSINFAGAKRTFAVFNDSNNLLANSLESGTLSFTANSGGELLFDLKPGESLKKDIVITNSGTLNFQYNLVVENISDNANLCDKIQSSVDLNGSPVYSGSLINFTSGDIVFVPNEQRWTFNVFLPSESDNLENKTCQFKFVFNGRQDNLPSGLGFNDTQNIQSNFQIDPNSCDPSDDDGEDYQTFHENKEDEGGKDGNNEKHCERHDNNGKGERGEDKENKNENKKEDNNTLTPEINSLGSETDNSNNNQSAEPSQPTPTDNNPAI